MNLVWHIASKDLRRLAWPVAAWLAFIVVPTIGLRVVSPSVEGHASSSLAGTAKLMSIWSWLVWIAQGVMGYVLAASMVLEDPVRRAGAFWLTRPISGATMLAAKAMAAALLFVVAPLIALAPVWLASGFGLGDILIAGADFSRWQGVATLIAIALAATSRSFAETMLYSVALAVATFAGVWLSAPSYYGVPAPLRDARSVISFAVLVSCCALALAQPFVTRRAGRAWAVLGVGFAGCMAIRAAWPWDFGGAMSSRSYAPPHAETAADRAAEITPAPTWTQFRSNSLPTLFVTAPWSADGYYVPVLARFADGTIGQGAVGAGESQSGLRVLGFNADDTPLRWQIMAPKMIGSERPEVPGNTTRGRRRMAPTMAAADTAGVLEIWAVRPVVLGEIPLRKGEELSAGSNRVRIVELVYREKRLDEIFVAERDPSAQLPPSQRNEFGGHLDRYFLVNRATGKAQQARAGEAGPAVVMNGLALRYRRLFVSGNDDWRDAVLVKLRLEGVRRFERPLEARDVTLDRRG